MKRECKKCGAVINIDTSRKLIESIIARGLCSDCQKYIIDSTK
jgi:hypothetical protein